MARKKRAFADAPLHRRLQRGCGKRFGALLLVFLTTVAGDAQPPPGQPPRRIVPGQVIVPTERMRRPWGELIGLDLKTRTGTFRQESNDEVVPFTVLPYAELYHHAAFGDLQDFRVGERAIFRLHENDQGKWVWLTYIQDELNFLVGHKEFYFVERIDAATGRLAITQANGDRSFVRTKGLFLDTDAQTRYWKAGRPARFADVKVGDRLRTQTHGAGKGQMRVCWEVFLDEDSVLAFQARQRAVHARRMQEEGLPGFVDRKAGQQLDLTLFIEAREESRALKAGQRVRVAPAGVDRKPSGPKVVGTVRAAVMAGNLGKVTVTLEAPAAGFAVTGLARLWAGR